MTIKITIEGPSASSKTLLANWLYDNLPRELINSLHTLDEDIEQVWFSTDSSKLIDHVLIETKQTND